MPKRIVAAAAYVTNDKGEVLLVKTHWRADTWECPGGQVNLGESPIEAARRETLEETGMRVRLDGVTGVYYNAAADLVSIMFRGKVAGGELRCSPETQDVRFVRLTPENVAQYVTRPHTRSRILDAMLGSCVPCEAFHPRPHHLLERLEGSGRH